MQAQDYDSFDQIADAIATTRTTFLKGITVGEDYRRQQLEQLYLLITENEDDIIKAVQSDMHGRPANEIRLTEISFTKSEIAHQINHLSEYMQPKKISSTAAFMTDSGYLHYTPLGNVLIISPWNFPIQLTIAPFAGAIAAGCTAVIKPSEVSGNVATLFARLIPKYMDSQSYQVINGAARETTELLRNKFDLIFFTGGCKVGKIVAKAAALHLTPYVLELGGKNPVVLDDECDFAVAAQRIAWGRWALNAGQVCLSPEYIIVNRQNQDRIIKELQIAITRLFGDNPQMSENYARVINGNHFDRLNRVLSENKENIAIGGQTDKSDYNYISPTVLKNVSPESPIMRDEVFGPIISVFPVDNVRTDAIPIIQNRPKPLALYVFSNNKSFSDQIVNNTDSGGVTINDVLVHIGFPGFPFGGTGYSGTGAYHGWYSFAAFCHEKPVLSKYAGASKADSMREPPFTDFKAKVYRFATEEKPRRFRMPFSVSPLTAAAIAGAAYWLKSRL